MNKTFTIVVLLTTIGYIIALYEAISVPVPNGYNNTLARIVVGISAFSFGSGVILVSRIKNQKNLIQRHK